MLDQGCRADRDNLPPTCYCGHDGLQECMCWRAFHDYIAARGQLLGVHDRRDSVEGNQGGPSALGAATGDGIELEPLDTAIQRLPDLLADYPESRDSYFEHVTLLACSIHSG